MPFVCNITFDNHSAVYYSGQEVSGNVNLVTDCERTVLGLYIDFQGYAKVRWVERHTRKENNRTRIYDEEFTSHQQYIECRTYVVGSGTEAFTLNKGNFNYPFKYQLPSQIPTSFTGPRGHIRYEVVFNVSSPSSIDTFKKPFTVIFPLNLNLNSKYSEPALREDIKTISCCCTSSESIDVKLSIPINGFVCGQQIPFTLLVRNESNVDVGNCCVWIKQEVEFQSSRPYVKIENYEDDMPKTDLGKVQRLCNKEYRASIPVQVLPPTTIDICQFIKIYYYFVAKLEINSRCTSNMYLYIPITIGTIPVVSTAQSDVDVIVSQPEFHRVSPNLTALSKSPLSSSGDSPPSYNSFSPPSYQEIAKTEKFEDPDEKSDSGKEFLPKYPVYMNFTPSAPPPPEN